MPPRTRTKPTKVLKENVDAVKKTKVKSDGKITKPPRKALADKTNSLSDDNASIDVPIKTYKADLQNKAAKTVSKDGGRSRRERRLPARYVENQVLNNLSSKTNTPVKNQTSATTITETLPSKPPFKDGKVNPTPSNNEKPVKKSQSKNAKVYSTASINEEVKSAVRTTRKYRLQSVKEPLTYKKPETLSKQSISSTSPFKTPSQSLDSSFITNRPRRISRLPSKFEDHSISPHKFIPIQPCHASTPIVQKKSKTQINNKSNENVTKPGQEKRITRKDKANTKKEVVKTKSIKHFFTKTDKEICKKSTSAQDTTPSSKNKTSPDTNNNPKGERILPKRVVRTKSPTKEISPKAKIKTGFGQRLLDKSLSFRVLEDRKPTDKDQDVYEFTYDPNEEPHPQKKKRKKVVKKRPPKHKTVILKNNYEKNVEKALESLKSKVKPSKPQNTQQEMQTQKAPPVDKSPAGKIQIIEDIIIKPAENKTLNYTTALPVNESAKSIHMSNYASIHVEDIAADFEVMDNNDDINYSPVNSPCRPKTPDIQTFKSQIALNNSHVVNSKDPLNLQGDTSFFDDQPVASSSMNISVRHPLASPWRVEFGNLPIRWQANTYVKSNMTPAVESSFINSEEISKKKHVYTDIVAEEPLPRIEDPPSLKQPSIISFMREVAERSLKKKRGRSVSPTKANSLFEDISNTDFGYKTPKKARKEKVVATPNASDISNDKSCEKEGSNQNEISNENHNEISNDIENSNPKENSSHSEKSPTKNQKKKDKDGTFFGFNESDSYDQENVSPVKNIRHTRAKGLRPKSRAVLQEINALSGPTRAILPIAAKKLASSEVVEKLYDQLKSAEDAPLFPEKEKGNVTAATNDEPSLSDDGGQSVHLFEDIEFVHHLKPQRKSYGKAKKVTFRQRSNSDSDTQSQMLENRSSNEDDLGDLTFQVASVKQKKVTKKKKPKKQLSKKEEKEVDEWAAGFNSMCEDIDEFPLVVE